MKLPNISIEVPGFSLRSVDRMIEIENAQDKIAELLVKPGAEVNDMISWYMAGAPCRSESVALETNRVGDAFRSLGNDILSVSKSFKSLSRFERSVVDNLRDIGVSIPDILDYLHAAPGLNADGRPLRADVATDLRKKEFLATSERIKSSGRSAAIMVGCVALLAVGGVVAAAGAFPAVAVALAPAKVAVASIQAAATQLVQFAAGSGAVAVIWKAWNGWQKIRSGSPRLSIGKDEDFTHLPSSLGRPDYATMNDEYEAIPGSDRYLISHLSATEMRMLLKGSDGARRHILSANPPDAWSKIQSRVDQMAQGKSAVSRLKRAGAVCAVIITAPWNRDAGNGRIPDLDRKLETWRANASINKSERSEPMEFPDEVMIRPSVNMSAFAPDEFKLGCIPVSPKVS